MLALRKSRWLQPWRDWLLLIAGLVALCIPVFLVADAAYRNDHTILYWLLIAYSYPDGKPAATVVGIAALALGLVLSWISLHLLARTGLSRLRALGVLALTALATAAACGLLLAGLFDNGDPLLSRILRLCFGLLIVAPLFGLLSFFGVLGTREPAQRRALSTLLRPATLLPMALVVVATFLALIVAPLGLLVGERYTNYNHLASADFASQRYYLAWAHTPSEGAYAVLYRCDTPGVWCQQIDTLGDAGQSAGGHLRYDPATRTLTVSEQGQALLTYPAGDLFVGP
jgi:hypothetical protein